MKQSLPPKEIDNGNNLMGTQQKSQKFKQLSKVPLHMTFGLRVVYSVCFGKHRGQQCIPHTKAEHRTKNFSYKSLKTTKLYPVITILNRMAIWSRLLCLKNRLDERFVLFHPPTYLNKKKTSETKENGRTGNQRTLQHRNIIQYARALSNSHFF